MKIDWSEKCWKEMLVYQRKFLWLEDTVAKLARWLGLKPGMTAVDVGCGLGYLVVHIGLILVKVDNTSAWTNHRS
jgi:protein-L-isoaspartate O-methyltransferase